MSEPVEVVLSCAQCGGQSPWHPIRWIVRIDPAIPHSYLAPEIGPGVCSTCGAAFLHEQQLVATVQRVLASHATAQRATPALGPVPTSPKEGNRKWL